MIHFVAEQRKPVMIPRRASGSPRTLNLKRGTYRVVVAAKYGLSATTSEQASLTR